jgi:hypothetical protein
MPLVVTPSPFGTTWLVLMYIGMGLDWDHSITSHLNSILIISSKSEMLTAVHLNFGNGFIINLSRVGLWGLTLKSQ